MEKIKLTPGELDLAALRQISEEAVLLELEPSSYARIEASAQCVKHKLEQNEVMYGINTGFGLLANTRIPAAELEILQKSLVLSHAAGVGELLPDSTVRLIMALKINSLARGFSGIRATVIDTLITLFNQQIYPCIPAQGSVGASGDLAPLAHMSCILIGEGEARVDGKQMSAKAALEKVGLKPLTLQAKEGLALLNGTQASTALALEGLFEAENGFASALISGAMAVEAAMGSHRPFDERIHKVRGLPGQIEVAAILRDLLADSDIAAAHINCDKVQDPYSLRCQPQVMGACLEQLRHSARLLQIEANAVSDNPLVFADDQQVLSGGNFHAEPVGMAADSMALAIAEIGALAERRIALLVDNHLSGLPPFLVNKSGTNSGFMIAQVTAAALASENKGLSHPAVVDSIPTSAGQEDHVSMATHASRRLLNMNSNTHNIIAIELLAATQGVEFRKPNNTSPILQKAFSVVRNKISFYDKDRIISQDINKAKELIKLKKLTQLIPKTLFLSTEICK